MKIEEIRVIVASPGRNFVRVKSITDEVLYRTIEESETGDLGDRLTGPLS